MPWALQRVEASGRATTCMALGAYDSPEAAWERIEEMAIRDEERDPKGVITIATADEFGAVMQFQYMRDKCVVLRRPVRVSEEEARRIVWTTRLVKSGRRDVGSLVEMIIAVEDITGMPYGAPDPPTRHV